MKYLGRTGEYFEILEQEKWENTQIESIDGQLSMIWFKEDGNKLNVDGQEVIFNKDQIMFCTSFNKVKIIDGKANRYLRFNTPFYCILDHDSEVGCKGILFYGSSNIPILNPSTEEVDILDTVWKMLVIEMQSNDNLQLEMLQMMLKRILILSTRIYKTQENFEALDVKQTDIVRDFNFLVEQHFKEKHSVSEYASLLNKSPKTLSNLFGKLSDKSPLQVIQNRIMLEVRRMLRYTDQPISEIGYDVGFSDVQSFSRFFKKHQGVSPSEYRVVV